MISLFLFWWKISFSLDKMECSQQKRFPRCIPRGAVQLPSASVGCWPQPVLPDPPWTVLSLLLQEQRHWGRWGQLHPGLWSTTQAFVHSSPFSHCLSMFLCLQTANVLWVRRLSRDVGRFEREKMRLGCPFPASNFLLHCLLLNLRKEVGSLTVLVQPQQLQKCF